MRQNEIEARLLDNAKKALIAGFRRTFLTEPEVIDLAEAANHAPRLVAGGEGAFPEWKLLYGKRRIVWT